jgi:hypothetical protein
MTENLMGFLGARRADSGYGEDVIGKLGDRRRRLPDECDRDHADLSRRHDGLHDVCGAAARGQPDEDIAGAAMPADAADEDVVVGVVVPHCGQRGDVVAQRDGREWLAVEQESPDQLRGQVLRVGLTASVSAEQDAAALAQAGSDLGCGDDEGFGRGGRRELLEHVFRLAQSFED